MGVTGTAVLIEFARQLKAIHAKGQSLAGLTIITVEKHPTNGPGYPYNPVGYHHGHLLNHPATEMALRAVDENGEEKEANFEVAGWHSYDFIKWMEEQRQRLVADHAAAILATHPEIDLETWQPDPIGHYSRGLFGLYLEDRCAEAIASLKRIGVAVETHNKSEVIDVYRKDDELVLSIKAIRTGTIHTRTADKLLLATGRWAKSINQSFEQPFCFDHPYPAATVIKAIKPATSRNGRPKRVIIVGTGLSALDCILSVATGEFYRDTAGTLRYKPGHSHAYITAISRSGYFPIVRGLPKEIPRLRHLTAKAIQEIKSRNNGFVTLPELEKLFQKELETQLGHAVDIKEYFTPSQSAEDKLKDDLTKAREGNVVYATCRQILALQLYSQLNHADQRYFVEHLRTFFLQNVAAMPVINAEKMVALIDAGILEVARLGHKGMHIDIDALKQLVRVHYEDNNGQKQTLTSDYIIRAAGDELEITKNQAKLIQSLLSQEAILPGQSGGIKVDASTYAVIRKDDLGQEAQSRDIYALGMPVMNWAAERDFASASVKAAHQLLNNWIDEITLLGQANSL